MAEVKLRLLILDYLISINRMTY